MKAQKSKVLLVLALVGVVGMAFRVSWNALRDVARAIGADDTGAMLYPFVVDGLMALALVAMLILTDRSDRRFAGRVLAAYTIASLVLNYVHGLMPALHSAAADHGRLADTRAVNWALVLLATSLPVGSIYFGSDLVAKVLHHQSSRTTVSSDDTVERSMAEQEVSTSVAPSTDRAVVGPATPHREPIAAPPVSATIEPIDRTPARQVAAEKSAPRRATGRVPNAARSSRPNRTADQLLVEARKKTADWSAADLTAEAIRKEVHTAPAKARVLRDALKAERAQQAASASTDPVPSGDRVATAV